MRHHVITRLLVIGWICSLGLVRLAPPLSAQPLPMQYPPAAKVPVIDNYHGRVVADPFRWLEDSESDQTAAWIESQNELTKNFLSAIPERKEMRMRLERLWNHERYGLPIRRGSTYFYAHNDGLQDQSIYYKADGLDATPTVLLDPHELSPDGTVAIAAEVPSDDGKLLAYAVADGGSDWRTWRVRDVASGRDLEDLVQWVKFSGIAWLPDGSGFFYARYDPPADGQELTGTNENQQLFFHRIGDDQAQDRLILARPDQPQWGFSPQVTDDGRFLVIQNWQGSEPKAQIFLKDLRQPDSPVRPLISGFDAEYEFVGSRSDTLYFVTDNGAPRRRLIAVSAGEEDRDRWREVIAEADGVLESARLFGQTFYVTWLQGAHGAVSRHAIDGQRIDDVPLNGVGTVSGFGGRQDAQETFFSFTNYITPESIYRVDLTTGQTSLWRAPQLELNAADFITEQLFCISPDGTRVPIIVTRRRDSKLDGSNRTILYGYGGFNISITPSFSPATAAWIDAGGIYAVANLRGGGEYGRQWHEDGMRLNKQNVFDDFIAAAEHLIEKKYTSASKLAAMGRSNGGLLVGAVMTQRPELFGACLPSVGVLDMLRYHKFTIGWAWVAEYGSSDESDQIDNLLSYSPVHNLKLGECYPATLITTAERDDRVVPAHSFKFAAALQAAQGCEHPILIRIETRAGHGAGTPVSKKIDEYADLWAFLLANLR
jgi:prolyl oligopeptidase